MVSSLTLLLPMFFLTATSIAYQNIRYMAFGETNQAITLLADGTIKIFDLKFDLSNLSWLQYPAVIVNQIISGPIRLIYLAFIWVRDNAPSLIQYFK